MQTGAKKVLRDTSASEFVGQMLNGGFNNGQGPQEIRPLASMYV